MLITTSIHLEAQEHPLSRRGNNQFIEKNYESALLTYNELIQEFPERKEGYFNRGLCLYRSGKFSEAILDFNDCISIDSQFVAAKFLKGMCIQSRGDLNDAFQIFSEIASQDATIFSVNKRIKTYELSVYIATRWYYMIALLLLTILLFALITGIMSGRKTH